jgi:enediyne biosynthesis protein E4
MSRLGPCLALGFVLVLSGCARGDAPSAPAATPRLRFADATGPAGIRFVHRHGGEGKKYLIETMGPGVCVLDFDGDGLPDLFLVQSAPLPEAPPDPALHSVLYRNHGDGTFTDVTREAGVGNVGRYGMGCAVGDVDNDSDPDLYVTNFGPNALYRNNGDGTFTEIGKEAGVDDPRWGASAAFADYDGDSHLDLFVTNYLDFTLAKHKRCGDVARNLISYCHPDAYEGIPDVLYRNNGDGTFTDVTRRAGLWSREGKGLGAVWTDFDRDGDPDLFVANDSVRNFLFQNNGDGTFSDVTLLAGVGYSEEGRPEAGMGVDAGDADGDGLMDLFVTHLSNEVNELYRNNGDGTFSIATHASGLGEPSLLYVGWGTFFLDADDDGDPDLFVTNGHVMDDIEAYSDSITYLEPDFLFENLGSGRYVLRGDDAGAFFREKAAGRGAAVLDYDRDGRLDIALTRNNAPARLLHNETVTGNHWLSVRLRGTRSNRDGIGAWLTLKSSGGTQVAERRGGSSYLSASEGLVHFGLGRARAPLRLEVRWPSGLTEAFTDLVEDRTVSISEGSGRRVQ